LEGLVMGTRSGDVDPALPFFLADHLNMSLKAIDRLLNQESGLKGLCGINDMREVMEQRGAGNEQAEMALEVYCYRIKKYIGAYYAVLGFLDALVFTGGIGENVADVRAFSCEGLEKMGIVLDNKANRCSRDGIKEISPPGSTVRVLVVPTNEELRIAQETMRVIGKRDG
jgi:acetate kinase